MNHFMRTHISGGIRSNRFQKRYASANRRVLPVLLALFFFLTGCGVNRSATSASKTLTSPPSKEIAATAPVSVESPAESSAALSAVVLEEVQAVASEDVPAQSPTQTTIETPDAPMEVRSPEATDSMAPDAASPTDTKSPSPEPSSPVSGIIVKSGNELSSVEKQQLLEALEKELDALFAEINDVSAEEEMEAQN